jgi:hypothetical protein
MWAKVITLANITTGDGKHLTQECKEANFTSDCHHSLTHLIGQKQANRIERAGNCGQKRSMNAFFEQTTDTKD